MVTITSVTMGGTELLARCLYPKPTAASSTSGGHVTNLIQFSSLNAVFALIIMIRLLIDLFCTNSGVCPGSGGYSHWESLDIGLMMTAGLCCLLGTNSGAQAHAISRY